MRLKDIVRAEKSVSEWGKWQQVKMPPSAFPLSRRRSGSYRLSGKFTWRVVIFSADGKDFRLLVAFRKDLSQYEAILGLVEGNDTKVLASYEFHGSHVGWHIHANCDSIDRISPGIKKSGREIRLPRPRTHHRRKSFDIDEDNALDVAAVVFGLPTERKQWKLI